MSSWLAKPVFFRLGLKENSSLFIGGIHDYAEIVEQV